MENLFATSMEGDKESDNPWTITRRRTKASSSISAITSDRHRTPRATLLSLPLEICAQIASYLSPTAVYGLTCLCRGAYQLFNPSLYHTIYSKDRSESLLRTLSSVPQNARLVRNIDIEFMLRSSVWQHFTSSGRHDTWRNHSLIRRRRALYDVIFTALRNLLQPSLLRSFTWRSNLPFDKVVTWSKSNLPSTLQGLSIIPIDIQLDDFQEMEYFSALSNLPALESFAYEEAITDVYKVQKVDTPSPRFNYLEYHLLCISNAMKRLHLTQLQTLRLSLNFNHEAADIEHMERFFQLFRNTVNSLVFPRLRTLLLHVRALASDTTWEFFDFREFLRSHPTLIDVAIEMQDLPVDADTLPALRRLECRPSDSVSILGSTRPIETVKFWMPFGTLESHFLLDLDEDDDSVSVRKALASTPTLRDLSLTPDNIRFKEIEMYWGECFIEWAGFIPRVVRACPLLLRLELYSRRTSKQTFKEISHFQKLEVLHLHLWQWLESPMTESERPQEDDLHMQKAESLGLFAEDVFKMDVYQREISAYLVPCMPDLRVVHLEVLGAVEPRWPSTLHDKPAFPQVKIQYDFRIVTRDGKRVVAGALGEAGMPTR